MVTASLTSIHATTATAVVSKTSKYTTMLSSAINKKKAWWMHLELKGNENRDNIHIYEYDKPTQINPNSNASKAIETEFEALCKLTLF